MLGNFDMNTSCGSWERLQDHFYRKFEVYDMSWDSDIDITSYNVVIAPNAGPIAITRRQDQLQKLTSTLSQNVVKIFTLSGDELSQINVNIYYNTYIIII